MIIKPKRRILVPAWRTLNASLATGELSKPKVSDPSLGPRPELDRRRTMFEQQPNVLSAAEFIETALVYNAERDAVGAATFILDRSNEVMPLVAQKAQRLLSRHVGYQIAPNEQAEPGESWRARIRDFPRDALAWVELARIQISSHQQRHTSGSAQTTPAERSMAVALSLAPDNRFVLRAAARLFFHLGDFDKAHDIVRRSEATPHDPWLMATEIALSETSRKSSMFLRRGAAFLSEGGVRPRQITELAGAIGTNWINDGNHKRGKRLFEQSMVDPTMNSIAQAEWASQEIDETLVSETQLDRVSDASEARARHCHAEGNFEEALIQSIQWINQEPFSTTAFEFAIMAANILQDYAQAEQLARSALNYNPKSASLRNSLAFAIGSQTKSADKLAEAAAQLTTVPAEDKRNTYVAEANRGLIAFRRGHLEQGVAHYDKAVAGFRSIKDDYSVHSALTYKAREAVLALHPDAEKFVQRAKELALKRTSPAISRLIASVEKLSQQRGVDKPS